MSFVSKYSAKEIEELLDKVAQLPDSAELATILSEKVNATDGKGLSEENFTRALKEKLESIKASDVVYNTDEFTNVKEALDFLLYTAPAIEQFFVDKYTYEIGEQINQINFSFSCNRPDLALTISPLVGEVTNNSASVELQPPLVKTTTFTLSATDGRATATKSLTIQFLVRGYWGTSENDNISEAEIKTFVSDLLENRNLEKKFDCSGGRYIYICIPKQLCSGDVVFTCNNLVTDFELMSQQDFTNSLGVNVPMNVFRSLNKLHGNEIRIKVQ